MARQLFIKEEDIRESSDFLLANLNKSPEVFRDKMSDFFNTKIQEKLEQICDAELRPNIYLLGSFSRNLGGLNSDLDLVYFGEDTELVESFNEKLRKVFGSYSLKMVSSVDEFIEKSDEKGLMAGCFLKPLFFGLNWSLKIKEKVYEEKELEIQAFLKKESSTRKKRYGVRPGRVNFNLKHSPGGLVDMFQATWLWELIGEPMAFSKEADFLYKLRMINYHFAGTDNLQISNVKDYKNYFDKQSDQDFFKAFYSAVYTVHHKRQVAKGVDEKDRLLKLLEAPLGLVLDSEINLAKKSLEEVKGLLLAPSYHVWTVDEHSIKCVEEILKLIAEFSEEFSITEEEEIALVWAALFHDIKKGKEGSHSVLGAEFVQTFGRECKWPSERIELVSWLVREHLTLVKLSFKSDPYEPEFLKNTAVRGCVGRNAILLFLLSCADLTATNPESMSKWKKDTLKQALDQILGKESKMQEDLLAELKGKALGLEVGRRLNTKELCMIPNPILKEDLKVLSKEGFAFYEHDNKIWVRSFLGQDEDGFASKFIESLVGVGAYVHHAVFKTMELGVYNWVCVESGASLKAFKNRFEAIFKAKKMDLSEEDSKVHSFKRIRKTFEKESYAVISFKGPDHKGALSTAISMLRKRSLNIEWGHAVTWGADIEDVFGVSFDSTPDWSFLTTK